MCASSASTSVDERCRLAEAAGAIACAKPDGDGIDHIDRAVRAPRRTASAPTTCSSRPAARRTIRSRSRQRIARDRATVVDIGKTRLDLPWNDYYDKELDVRFSRSYGPGRYDDRYELEGIDYPAGYVRWTERRNLACFIDLVERGALPIDLLVSGTFPVDDAPDVYAAHRRPLAGGIGFLFEYPEVIAATNR